MFFSPKKISVKLRHVLCRWVFRMHQMLLWSQGFWASDLYRSPAGCWAVPTEVCCGVWSSLLLLKLPSVSFPMSLEHFHLILLQIPSTRTLAVDINDSPAADQHPDGCPGPWPHWTCLTLTTHQRRGGQTFSEKGQKVNILDMWAIQTVTTTLLCRYCANTATGDTERCGRDPVPAKLPEYETLNFT